MPETPVASGWKTQPIFITSTFRDMQAERDHLSQVVFPALQERLRERRYHLEPIDLRVGVETATELSDEAKELRVLKVCLDEIERSRPFLLVLLGDRYGWVPPPARAERATREARFEVDIVGKSVTALEVEFGILKKGPAQRRRCLFYFREALPYAEMPEELAARYSDAHSQDRATRARHGRLTALKAELAHDPELGPRVRHYEAAWDRKKQRVGGLKAWGQQVLDELWAELDEETRARAVQPDPPWEVQEREALEEFGELRMRDFKGRAGVTGTLLAHARSAHEDGAAWGLLVTARPGHGKSALFANVFRALQADSSVVLLAHAAGISNRATQVDAMLRRFVQELAVFLGVVNPLPENASAEDVEKAFASVLSRASARRRVVVLLDALNQFEPTVRAQHLTWLPKPWPANARLIATVLEGVEAKSLAERIGVLQEPLEPLVPEESQAIALAVAERYHREFNPAVLDAVLTKQADGVTAAGNPLWLQLAMEELNLLDADDFARADRDAEGTEEEKLHRMVLGVATALPATIEELYGAMLAGTERRYGEPWARALACAITLSRFGWRESDLRVLAWISTDQS